MFFVVYWCLFLVCLSHDFLHADLCHYCSENIFVSCLGRKQLPVLTTIDKSVSDAIKVSKHISMKKNIVLPEKNIETSIITTKFDNENGQVSTSTRVWPSCGYWMAMATAYNFNLKENNHPENSIIYINQAYLTIKNNKRMFYGDDFLLGQIIEAINPPKNISNYVCKECEVKMYRLCYDTVTGQFLSLYETIS